MFFFVLFVLFCPCVSGLQGAQPGPVVIKADKDQVDFLVGGTDVVARYHIGADVAKPYLWPLKMPNGKPITRPPLDPEGRKWKDHPHQKSAWFCHGDIIPEGMPLAHKVQGVEGVDFWSEAPGHGRIVCTKVEKPHEEKEHAWIKTSNDWRTADGQLVLDEIRIIHLYNFGHVQLFVFDIELHAGVVPLTFGDTKEGSFGIRINEQLQEKGGKGHLENADGKEGEAQCWGRQSAWCDYSGPLGDKTWGLAIFDDPSNPSPACWHSRGYGLMAANPFGRAKSGFPAVKGKTELVRLAKGEHLKLRYGLFLHVGDATEGKVGEYFEQFVKLKK
jgi:hypothetical protein